jgi:hypothetical protein
VGRYLFLVLIPFTFILGCGPSTTARVAEKQQQNVFLRQQIGQMKGVEGKWIGCMTPFGSNRMPSSVEVNKMLVAAFSDQAVHNEKMTQAVIASKHGKGNGKKPAPPPNDDCGDAGVPPIMTGSGAPKCNPDPPPSPPPTPTNPNPVACRGGLTVILQIMVVDLLQADPVRNQVDEIPTLNGTFKTVAADEQLVVFTSGLYREDDEIIQLTSTASIAPSNPAIAPTILQVQINGDTLTGRYLAPQVLADVTFKRAP